MFVEQVAPTAITENGRFLGRADNVSEENGGKHPVSSDRRFRAGQKLLDCIGDLCRVLADEGDMVGSREFDIVRSGNVLGQITPPSTLIVTSSVRWTAKVGTRMVGRILRTSIWLFIRMSDLAAEGLAPSRSNRPHQRWKA
jgi:hypothetical protein